MITPHKKQVGSLIKAIADQIETCSNETVVVDISVTFNKDDKKGK